MLTWAIFAGLFFAPEAFSQVRNFEKIADRIIGAKKSEKFSFHRPSYFVFGDDDLKLQFSLKYRLARSLPIYFAYSQLMFWKIYEESKPFEDVNYNPEAFYRIIEQPFKALKAIDIGYLHTSNGRADVESRSLDRVFVRSNFITKFEDRFLGVGLMLYHIYNEDETNEDIVRHLGYWEASVYLADVIKFEEKSIDLETRVFAGSKVFNFDQGGHQIGLIYNFGSENFNPSIYIQRYEGFAESLIRYNKKRTEHRIGLMFSF